LGSKHGRLSQVGKEEMPPKTGHSVASGPSAYRAKFIQYSSVQAGNLAVRQLRQGSETSDVDAVEVLVLDSSSSVVAKQPSKFRTDV
jgi:hypothetical protein